MAVKTSQLQIRVTEEEKAALKRLARAANLSVSRYVLSQALRSREGELVRMWDALARPGKEGNDALDQVQALILRTPPDGLAAVVGDPPLERLNPIVRNQLAAIVERGALLKGVEPPDWVTQVPPLARPHFGWSLPSLQPHQIRVTPVAFKRRGLFFDPATRPALAGRPDRGAQSQGPLDSTARVGKLASLAEELAPLELKAEFYFLGGAVLFQGFHAHPTTAQVSALFRAPGEVSAAAAALAQREGWEQGWLNDAVKELLAHGRRPERHFETPNLAVFVPTPEYVLAVKVASLPLGTGVQALDDLRYVMRGLNLATPDAALEIAGRYFGMRQLPPHARDVLAGLLSL